MAKHMPKPMKIAIIGGGIAGLAAAYRLLKTAQKRQLPIDVALFEATDRLGGIIKTTHDRDCLLEEGPDSFVTFKPAAVALCNELSIGDQLISTNKQNRRAFIVSKGKLVAIPPGFVMIAPTRFDPFFKSELLSRTGKLRVAIEKFLPKSNCVADESVAAFVTRRFGGEALEKIAQPMLAGIYTADPTRLSLRATMPQFLELEQNYGSVITGLLQEQRARREGNNESAVGFGEDGRHPANASGARYDAFVSFANGMQFLVDTLVGSMPGLHMHLGAPVLAVRKQADDLWSLVLASQTLVDFDQIIMAVPTFVAAQLLSEVDPALARSLRQIEYASSAVVNLLFQRQTIDHPLDGFGFVVPAIEKKKIIAASFSSVKFPNLCPVDKALIRVFLGGALQPQVLALSDDELIKLALEEIRPLLALTAEPQAAWLKRWPKAMPQYEVGHLALVEDIEMAMEKHAGLHLAGNGFRGVGIPDCIESANKACQKILTRWQAEAVTI